MKDDIINISRPPNRGSNDRPAVNPYIRREPITEARVFNDEPINLEPMPTQPASQSFGSVAPTQSVYASSVLPQSTVSPDLQSQLESTSTLPPEATRQISVVRKLVSHPLRLSLIFLTLLIGLGGGFMLLKANQQVDSSLGSQASEPNILPIKGSQLSLNYDTLINGKLGIGIAPTGSANLQVAGDIQSSGGLFVSGGDTSLSSDGLKINSVTVCTPTGCTPLSTTSTAGGAGAAGAQGPAGPAGPAGATGLTGPAGADGADGCSADCVFLQSTTPGTAQTGHLNISGTAIAGSFSGDGTNVTNVNALTLQGNSASYYTNATNITAGTLNDARLSVNVSLLGQTIESAEVTNSTIVNDDISGTAAVAYAKLNLAASIVNADINTAAAIAYSKLNLAGSIANADVSPTAAIVYLKLDLSGTIVNSDIAASAAIAYSKLNLNGSIVNADVSNTAAIAYTKLNLAGSVTNADLAGSIADSKLSTISTAGKVADSALSSNITKYNDTTPNFTNNVSAPNFIGNLTGNVTGNSATASALAVNPSDCAIGSFATTIDASGNLTCSSSGSSLTGVDAATLQGNNAAYFTNDTNIASGTLDNARLSGLVTIQGNSFNGVSQLVQLDAGGLLPAINGSALTSLNASNLASGTVADARLSANVSLLGQTIDSAEIVNDSIVNADINSLAAIAYSKLNLGTSIVNADIAVGAAIAYSKLNLTNSVANGDLAGSIADSKLLTIATAGKVADTALSSNVALLNGTGPQTFTGNNKFTGTFLQAISSTTAFQIQNASNEAVLLVDSTNKKLRIYENVASPTNYLELYYDNATSTGIIAVNNGTVKLGSGTGPVTINAGTGAAVTITGHANSVWSTDAGSLTVQGGTTLTLQASSGNLSLLSSGNIVLGASDTTGTLLVLDTKTGAGDPTCVDGGLYYNSNAVQARACINGAWNNAVGTNTGTTIPTTNLYDGRTFRLRAGSSPYSFLDLVYDSTYGKWVSHSWFFDQRRLEASGTYLATTASNTGALMSPIYAYWGSQVGPSIPGWRDLDTAGLVPQVRWTATVNTNVGGTTAYLRAGFAGRDFGDASGSGDPAYVADGAGTWKDTAAAGGTIKTIGDNQWVQIPGGYTVKDMFLPVMYGKRGNTGGETVQLQGFTFELRWVSQ